MGNRPHVTTLGTIADVPETGANTETIVATLNNVCGEFPNPSVLLSGSLTYTAPAAITSLTIRVRQDSLTGTIVGEAEIAAGDVAATKLSALPFDFVDLPVGTFLRSYVLTVQGTGEGGPGTCNASTFTALVS